MKSLNNPVDILIVGSGPVGATFARQLHEAMPRLKILLIDAGPKLTSRSGMHLRNCSEEQLHAISQKAVASDVNRGSQSQRLYPPFGTQLVEPSASKFARTGMPAAAISSNVGGMGVFWTCACPRLALDERPTFISSTEWDLLYSEAESLLKVSRDLHSPPHTTIRQALCRYLAAENGVPFVQPMPLACTRGLDGKRYWSGADTILGHLADDRWSSDKFMLQSQMQCRKLLFDDHHVVGAIAKDLTTGAAVTLKARLFVVACDALRTPQLLWASGIKLKALGHYLNEHAQCVCTVSLHEEVSTGVPLSASRDGIEAAYMIPVSSATPSSHGQIMHLNRSPVPGGLQRGHFATLAWFCRKKLSYGDQIVFSDTEIDSSGMPKADITYNLKPEDRQTVSEAKALMKGVALRIGDFLDGGQPWTLPPGSSLHYQGTTRMGTDDDGTSVCSPHGQVWGVKNLFIGGNGILPTSTATNPTLTSVALAIRTSRYLADQSAI